MSWTILGYLGGVGLCGIMSIPLDNAHIFQSLCQSLSHTYQSGDNRQHIPGTGFLLGEHTQLLRILGRMS